MGDFYFNNQMLILKANNINGKYIFTKALESNSPVIFPTDTIYGIGAFISDIKANEKIFKIKGRHKNKPFPILISELKQLDMIIEQKITEEINKIINKYWPGPNTLIFKAKKNLPSLFVKNKTIAVRLIKEDWLVKIISHFNIPLSATSANISGESYSNNIVKIINDFSDDVSLFLTQKSDNKKSSKIIDISTKKIRIIRQ